MDLNIVRKLLPSALAIMGKNKEFGIKWQVKLFLYLYLPGNLGSSWWAFAFPAKSSRSLVKPRKDVRMAILNYVFFVRAHFIQL
jgi:hypothetical protein